MIRFATEPAPAIPASAIPAPDLPAPGPVSYADVPDPAVVPDPVDDVDALEELEEEITILAAHIHAATYRLLMLLADFDRRRGWELGGHRTCAHWLSFRTGIDLGAAREKVRTARVLVGLPQISASMSRGELSFSKVRALSRVATEENEADLLSFARDCTTAQVERMVRAVKRGSRKDEAAWELLCHESRSLSVFPDGDGMYVLSGRLPAEVGALVMRAVEAASDALYREKREPRLETDTQREKAAAQRRADALGLLAERALAAGFGGPGGSETAGDLERDAECGCCAGSGSCEGCGEGCGDEHESGAECCAGFDCDSGAGSDPSAADSDTQPIPLSGTRAERFQVMLHVEPATLESEGEPGYSELEDGTRVSAETSRRVSCDAGLVEVRHAPDGSILDVGRRTRTIPPAIRRALEARDGGCRFPGCGLRFTDGHHVKHWGEGGETNLNNLVLLCRYHHRLVHEGGWTVDWWGPGRAVFFDPRGGTHFDGRWRWPGGQPTQDSGRSREEGAAETLEKDPVQTPEKDPVQTPEKEPAQALKKELVKTVERDPVQTPPKDPVQTLIEDNLLQGAEPDGWTAGAAWEREVDIPDEISSAAWEAMLGG